MIRKNLAWFSLLIPLFFLGIACEGEDPYYASLGDNGTLNVTGNYRVTVTPYSALNNMTLTQSGTLVQAVDNLGTVYEGVTTGDIKSISVDPRDNPTFITAAITLQGTEKATGRVITMLLTQVNLAYFTPASGAEGPAHPSQQMNIDNAVYIMGFSGTYTDTLGISGNIVLTNSVGQFGMTTTAVGDYTITPTVDTTTT